jgi:hypothetical protein
MAVGQDVEKYGFRRAREFAPLFGMFLAKNVSKLLHLVLVEGEN